MKQILVLLLQCLLFSVSVRGLSVPSGGVFIEDQDGSDGYATVRQL